jgi:hypothetical protein
MKHPRWIAAFLLAIVAVPGGLLAQQPPSLENDLLLRIRGPIHVSAGDVANIVVVIGHDADVQGTVTRDLIVINGTARIRGTVQGNVTVANGHLELLPGARIDQKALLYRSTATRAPGAEVAAGVHEEIGFSLARAAWLFWFGTTFLVVVAGWAFAFLAERPLEGASQLILNRPGRTVVSALAVVFGLPALAFLALLSGIGIPLGFALLIFLLPALAFLGYLVTGSSLGHLALRSWPDGSDNPYLAIAVGLLALQAIALIPGLGGLVVLLASQLGAGALMYRVWRLKRGRASVKVGRAEVLPAV